MLKSLGRKKTAKVTGVSVSMANKWFIEGPNKRTPDITSLVTLADHLELLDEGLGELIRDTACIRATIALEELSRKENPSLKQGSVVSKLIRSNPILMQLHTESTKKPESKVIDHSKKEEFLNEERANKIEETKRQKKLQKLQAIREQIEQTKNN